MIGLSFASCESPVDVPKVEKITINLPTGFPRDGLPAGASAILSIKVEPEGASRAVTWKVDNETNVLKCFFVKKRLIYPLQYSVVRPSRKPDIDNMEISELAG